MRQPWWCTYGLLILLVATRHGHAQADESPLQHIARLAATAHQPLGIVLGQDTSLCGPAFTAAPSGEADSKAALLALARQFQLAVVDGTPLVLRSTRAGGGRLEEALNHRYDTLPVFTGVMGAMGASIDGWLAVYVDHVQGYGMSWASATDAEQLSTPSMTDASLEQLANSIVLSGSKGLWIAEAQTPHQGQRTVSLRILSYHDDRYGLDHLQCATFH